MSKFVSLKRTIGSVLAAALTGGIAVHSARAVDDVGDSARNFTITNHFTGEPLRLHDFAGSVILLDYFAYWCPYCRAQSPQIETNISRYYQARGGNSNGVPVIVLTVSFDNGNPSYTDQLIQQFGLENVADDFALTSYHQFGVSGQPFYVIINGVTNSTSHAAWQVLHRQSSYGGTVAPTNTLRAVLESVHPGPPVINKVKPLPNGSFQFTIPAQRGRTNRVEFSTNLTQWFTLTNVSGTNADVTVTDPSPGGPQRYYRVVRE